MLSLRPTTTMMKDR